MNASALLWYLLVGLGAVAAPLTLFAGFLHIWAWVWFRDRAGFRWFHVLTATGFALTTGTITWILILQPVQTIESSIRVWFYAGGLALAAIGTIGLTRDAIRIYVKKIAKETSTKKEGA